MSGAEKTMDQREGHIPKAAAGQSAAAGPNVVPISTLRPESQAAAAEVSPPVVRTASAPIAKGPAPGNVSMTAAANTLALGSAAVKPAVKPLTTPGPDKSAAVDDKLVQIPLKPQSAAALTQKEPPAKATMPSNLTKPTADGDKLVQMPVKAQAASKAAAPVAKTTEKAAAVPTAAKPAAADKLALAAQKPSVPPVAKKDAAPLAKPTAKSPADPALKPSEPKTAPEGAAALGMPALPQVRRSRGGGWKALAGFLLFVLVPTILMGYYLFQVAADQYTATAKFAIRSQSSSAPERESTAFAAVGFGNFAMPNIQDTLIVTEYIDSEQLLNDLQGKVDLRTIYSKAGKDWWANLDPSSSAETLLAYWRSASDVHYDLSTGVTTISVRAFDRDDAKAVADAVLAASEKLVNDMSVRSQGDLVRLAEVEAGRAKERLDSAVAALEDFQRAQQQIDPVTDAKGKVELQAKLEAEIASLQAKFNALIETISADSPTARLLKAQIDSLKAELAAHKLAVTASETTPVMGQLLGSYNKYQIDIDIATKLYGSALSTLENARQQAAMQSRYLVAFVRPLTPDGPTFPHRGFALSVTVLCGLFVWLFSSLVLAVIRDHS